MDIVKHFFQIFYQHNGHHNAIRTNHSHTNKDMEVQTIESNSLDSDFLDSLLVDIKSILLSVNKNNFALYSSTLSFQTLYNQCFKESVSNSSHDPSIEGIKLIQSYLLERIKVEELNALKPYIFRLNTAEILSNTHTRNFIQFLNQYSHTRKNSKSQASKLNLQTLNNELESLYKKLLDLQLGDSLYQKLNDILMNTKNQKFSIGITGVLSAGKSTFLNALLGKEILGSSTVPETANLTILKYGETDSAKVHFWNLQEWEDLQQTATHDANLRDFITHSNEVFGDKLYEYITAEGKSMQIEINELSAFTSANHESKLCNLVKEIELWTNLKFLQNGVEIVDTPGLDDPVTKREEITKAYIEKCDLLIHVMNASCAATQIDINFILESLLEQNISRLLVILTRADLITPNALQQSLEYTKSSLAMQLKKSHYEGDIESLLERIDFMPIASFLALLHRTNRAQEALDKGYTIEKTGMLEIEQYLDRVLLGENSLKHQDILYLAYRGFLKVVQKAQADIALESKILHASKEELENMLHQLKTENDELLASLENKTKELKIKAQELQNFLQTSENLIDKSLKIEQEKLKSRIYNDAIYGYEHNKIPSRESICEILSLALRDCFVDTNRDYKQKVMQKIMQILPSEENIELFNMNTDSKESALSHPFMPPKIDIQANKEQIFQSLALLESSVPEFISKHSLNSRADLAMKLDSVFNESFALFYKVICEKSKEISESFVNYFDLLANKQQEEIKKQIAHKEEILTQTLSQREKANSQTIKDSLAKKQRELDSLASELGYITHALSLSNVS